MNPLVVFVFFLKEILLILALTCCAANIAKNLFELSPHSSQQYLLNRRLDKSIKMKPKFRILDYRVWFVAKRSIQTLISPHKHDRYLPSNFSIPVYFY